MPRSFLLLIAIFCLAAFQARAGTVAVISSDSSAPYGEFVSALTDDLKQSNWRIASIRTADNPGHSDGVDLVITAGSEALRQALQRNSGIPILATLLARQSYEQILRETPAGSLAARRISAIFLDQPPERQAAFIRKLFPGQRQVAAVFGPETRHLTAPYRQAFADAGLTLSSEEAIDDSTTLAALNTLLPRNAVLLALPDSRIYRRNTIKAILVTAFRYQRPVIGYSAAFAKAGGLAALYSTPAQIAYQAAHILSAHGTALPPPTSPRLFSITVNDDVAAALGLNLKDADSLLQSLQADKELR